MCVIVRVKLARSIGNKGCTSISAHNHLKLHSSVCTQSGECMCGAGSRLCPRGRDSWYSNAGCHDTKPNCEVYKGFDWDELAGRSKKHTQYISGLGKDKRPGWCCSVGSRCPKELWREQRVFKLPGQNNHKVAFETRVWWRPADFAAQQHVLLESSILILHHRNFEWMI